MQRQYTRRFGAVLIGAWTALLLGSLTGPAVVVAGAPLMVIAVVGLLWPRDNGGTVTYTLADKPICFEGDELGLELDITPYRRLRYRVVLRDRGLLVGSFAVTAATSTISFALAHFGSVDLSGSSLIREGPFGLFEDTMPLRLDDAVKVFPPIEEVAPIMRMVSAPYAVGRHRSTVKSHAGLEFVDVRQAGPGDPLTDVNWKATARTGAIWLNERSSELPLDLVIFLDTFPSADLAQRTKLASNLARAHLRNFDRVGVVVFGGTIGWLPPATGHFQERLIGERLLLVRPYESAADKRIDLIPKTALPRAATVMVVSGLDDPRIVQAIRDLKFAGHPVIVVRPTASAVQPSLNQVTRLGLLIRRQLLADIANLDITVIDQDTWRERTDVDVF